MRERGGGRGMELKKDRERDGGREVLEINTFD